jgi:hypothetical protein
VLRDFSDVFADFIDDDGFVKPPITFAGGLGEPCVVVVDPDGIIASIMVHSLVDEEPCLLTMLFPMPLGAAQAKLRQKRYPVSPQSTVTVRRKLDEVVGNSGERYSRFEVDVT